MTAWDGSKRRANDNSSGIHDLVIRIDENVKMLKEGQASYKIEFDQHKLDDKRDFQTIRDEIIPIKNTLLKINGAWLVVVFILGLIIKFWK